MSQDKSSLKQRFDRLSVDIGTGMFSLQMTLSDFVIELLNVREGRQAVLDLSVPHLEGETYAIIHLKGIFFDQERETVYVTADTGEIVWGDLNILAQDIVVTSLHIQFAADDMLGNLS